MKKSFFIILALLVLACSSEQTQIPPKVLTHDEMVKLLIEVHLLEAKVKKLYLKQDSAQEVYNHLEKEIFAEQGVTNEQYKSSLEYYLNDVNKYHSIYEEVVDSLLSRQKRKDIH